MGSDAGARRAHALPPGPLPHRATYAGTKGYLVPFTRTLAAELGDAPVRVQVLCPGLTATEFHLTTGVRAASGPALASRYKGR